MSQPAYPPTSFNGQTSNYGPPQPGAYPAYGYPPGQAPQAGFGAMPPTYQPPANSPGLYPNPHDAYGQGYAPHQPYNPAVASNQQYNAGPIVNQPGPNAGWMSIPQGLSNCPPGLEYLTMIDQLLIHQKVELLEAFVGFETNNKFTIKNSIGQKVYYAVEDTDCLTRNCCGPARPFEMKIFDNYSNEVIHLHRPLACDKCCFPCCLQSIEVFAPPGNLVGTVQQEWSICSPSFTIRNATNDVVLKIDGPFCTFSFCGDVEFKVMSADGNTKVGKISKQWAGLLREMFTDSDYFGVTFPMDLDVKMKAVMMGACFLIDAMFFEKSGNRENDRPGMF